MGWEAGDWTAIHHVAYPLQTPCFLSFVLVKTASTASTTHRTRIAHCYDPTALPFAPSFGNESRVIFGYQLPKQHPLRLLPA